MAVEGGGVEALFWRGPITPGDVASWLSPGVLKDGGTGGGGSPTGPAGGDLAGTYPNPTLAWISRAAAKTLTLNSTFTIAGGDGGSLAIAANKTLTVSNSLTLAGTDSSTLNIGAGGTLTALAFTSPGSGVATALGNAAGGAGGFALVGTTPPTGSAGGDLTGSYPNPTLAWISRAASKTLTLNNTLTLAGTDSTTMTFPTTSATIARTDAAQTFTGLQTIPSITNVAGSFAVDASGNITAFNSLINARINLNSTSSNFQIASTITLGWTSGAANGTLDTILSRGGAAATLQFGAANAASPVAQTLQAQGSRAGTDNNIGGANLTIQSGLGTGIGTASTLIFRAPTLAASGTGAQTQTTFLTGSATDAKVGSTVNLWLGNAATTGLLAGALAALTTASIVIYDSTGQAYRIPCVI